MTIAYVGGTFDLFHHGHVRLLKAAHEAFDEVVVALNTDEFAERYKRKPVMSLHERMEVVEACRYVDRVVVNLGCEDSRETILWSGATHIVHGDDWTGPELMTQMGFDQAWLDVHGLEMWYPSYTKGISTTSLIERKA